LSYCWGGSQPMTTTSLTAQDFTNGIAFCQLPRTLRDAMTVTGTLGLQYVWIDCLCISQDDPTDLSREIARMADIFQGASVIISAACSSSVYDGFLVECTLPPIKRSPNTPSGTILLEQERRAYDPAEDPINLRAWTLQEHFLSRRTPVFGTRELWWTCEDAVSFDTLPTKRFDHVPAIQRKRGDDRFALDYWRSIVHDYTRRFLTWPNDKLPAIAGVAQIYAGFFNCSYLAGLCQYSLHSELMWCSNRSDITRPLAHRAPSWSWASVDGEIHHK
ncbi:HET-domain-containing protein, partial [Setomelanomma holmii]